MNKKKLKVGQTFSEKLLKRLAYAITILFLALMLYPFFFTVGNSMKDSKSIYDIPPKILPNPAKSMVINLDYNGLSNTSPETIQDMLLQDSTLLMFGISNNLDKESIYEYTIYAHMDGKVIFYTRVHSNLIQLERDYGVYASSVIKQTVLLARDRYKKVMDIIGYDFDLNGLSKSVNMSKYEDTYESDVKAIVAEDFVLHGAITSSGVKINNLLLLETFKYYLQMPQYAYASSPEIQKFGFVVFIMNTTIVIGFAIISQVILCSICAFVISRMLSRRAGKLVILFFMGGMIIPFASIMIPLLIMFRDMGAYNNYAALLLPFLYPTGFFVYLYKGFFDKIPGSYFDAAKIDGASTFYLYTRICLPLSKPIIALIGLQTFLGNWNDFFWAWLVTEDQRLWTLNVALYNISNSHGTKQNSILGLAIITITPVILLSIIFSKYLKQNIMATGVKG